jgi:hypothetical protein
MKNRLKSIFDELLLEVERNPELRHRINKLLGATANQEESAKEGRRRGNRRAAAVLDPYREFAYGEDKLKEQLQSLTVEQLKDVVSEHALDSSRLALKWKSSDRLVDLILTTVRNRLQKGDAFRN